MALKTHDFFVVYYEDDDLAHRFVEYFVNRWESEFNLKGLYYHRDAVIGKTRFAALEDNIDRSVITVVVFTKNFMDNKDNGFNQYATIAAFTKLLENISTTPCYIPIGVGLEESELPSCIRDILSVAKFKEYDWEQQVEVWRLLDNVLVQNELLTEEQLNKLGSTYKRYIRPAEKLISDKFLRDCIASRICYEYFSLGIGLNVTHQRLEQIKKTDSDPFNYIFKMLVTWREECEKQKMTEDDMVETLLEALREIQRLDVHERVREYAETFREKRQKEQEEKKRVIAQEEAEKSHQQRTNQQNNVQHNVARNGNASAVRTPNTELKYVAQEEQTSVMKRVENEPKSNAPDQGYVRLHGTTRNRRLPPQGVGEHQVTLDARDDSGSGRLESSAPLIPLNSTGITGGGEGHQERRRGKHSGGIFPESVPSWTLPVAVGVTGTVAVAVTAFVCLRYNKS